MNIQQFQYVLAVVDSKNFEDAAERCFITQSTLSTMIGRFENEIGIKIFNRKTKPVSVTAEGELLIKRLRIISNEVGALKNIIQEIKGEMVGELKLGIIPTVAPYLLPLFLTEFASKFPNVKIVVKEMPTAQIREQLKNRLLDVGILAIPIEDDELIEYPLFSEPFMVYDCGEKKLPISVAIEELDYSNLWLLHEGHCLRTQVFQICEQSNLNPKANRNFEFESGSMGSLLNFTKASSGMTIVPQLAINHLSKKEHKRLVPFSEPVPVRSIGLLTHQHFVKKRLIDELQTIVKRSVKDLIPSILKEQVIRPIH